MARCLGTGMQQDDESSHSHDITTTGAKTHEGEAESTPQAGSLFCSAGIIVLELCSRFSPISRSAALSRRQSAVLGRDRASVTDVGTVATD